MKEKIDTASPSSLEKGEADCLPGSVDTHEVSAARNEVKRLLRPSANFRRKIAENPYPLREKWSTHY